MKVWPLAVLLGISSAVMAAPVPSRPAPATRQLDGLWQGVIVYQPAQIELAVTVEMSGNPLVGTIDLPGQELKFHLLRSAGFDGSQVAISYDIVPGKEDPDNRFWLRGELAADGKRISGQFIGRIHDTEVRAPFTLERKGDAGTPRAAEVKPALHPLADDAGELRAAFNRDAGKLRLVMLLSPTCPACLGKVFVTRRYVLDAINDDRLRIYVVWGPMLGDEREENARAAATGLPDPRVTHFWTPTNAVATAFAAGIKLPQGLLAWDTYQLFAPGITWGSGVPAPTRFMQMNKPLPDELLFNGETLAHWIRDGLAAAPPETRAGTSGQAPLPGGGR